MSRITLDDIRKRLVRAPPRRIVEPNTIEAAVALVLVAYGREHDVELLLIKRATRDDDPWSGQMALPGGRRDQVDVDLMQTARRETREETGIALSPADALGELDDLHPRTPVLPPVVVRPFVFGLSRRPAVHLSDEAETHLWTSFGDLIASAASASVEVRGEELTVPSYRAGSHVVWGMTHRIIKSLIDLIK